ncbi:Ras- protein Rab-4A [Perkinsus chesapeaki]|uniref:Ras- protein Rab-4A n=1 Tax=Perkinsus chesapeaki TaxID=330153 RepID=A0A7J6MAJ6_PERCH|nr:Ras- protein Rab-4A [Perkinsus chesapeaki]
MRYAGTSSSTTSSSEAMAAAAAAVALSPLAARRASNNHISPLSSQLHEYDIRLKIIIIGDAGSGKSCIIKQFLDGIFNGYESAHTIGIEFASKIIKVNGKRVKLQIWDTAGQERYRTVTRSYYKGAAGVVLVYDITCRDSYNHIPTWLQDAKRETGEIDNIPIIILGNKKDLSTNSRQVSFLEASRFAQENSVLFMETSAATGEGIQEVFRTLTTRIFTKNRFFVGRVDLEDGIATLITYDHQSVNIPLSLLPDQLVVGEVLSMKVQRDPSAEDKRMQRIFQLQNDIAE